MKTLKEKYYWIMGIAFILAVVIGFSSLNPSRPNETDDTRFNVTRATKHIKEIAKEPHSIFDQEAHQAVREYLVQELEALGLIPEIYSYEDVFVERSQTKEDIKNIYAKLDGQSDKYIMLVTHYDSSRAKTERYAEVDGSFGAADAGYGLSTILETLRVIKENNIELVNGIKILITDGEEYGLLGAKEAVKEAEIFEGVEYLINLEARGIKGPAVMFETSLNNDGVVNLYKNSPQTFSYSINPEIYRLLPNGTDFTVFLNEEIKGINISVLDNLDYYHTPNDSYENISLKSIQHYGDQVVPIVTEFVSQSAYSEDGALESQEDAIFFTLMNGIFIKYSHSINNILLVVLLIGIGLLIGLDRLKIRKILKYIGFNLIMGIGFCGITFLMTKAVALLNGRPFKITYLPLIPYEKVMILALLIGAFVIYITVLYKISNQYREIKAYSVSSLIGLWLFSVIFTIILPGGSYLTVFPSLVTLVGLLLIRVLTQKWTGKWAYIMLIPFILVTILFVPTIYLFNCALTFGGLAVNMVFVLILYQVLVTCLLEIKTNN